MKLEGKKIAFAFTGAFEAFEKTIEQLEILSKIKNVNIIPIMSYNSYFSNTKYGKSEHYINRIEKVTQNKIIYSIINAEKIGNKNLCDVFVIAPCTGNTIAKLANDIIDTPVTMRSKISFKK